MLKETSLRFSRIVWILFNTIINVGNTLLLDEFKCSPRFWQEQFHSRIPIQTLYYSLNQTSNYLSNFWCCLGFRRHTFMRVLSCLMDHEVKAITSFWICLKRFAQNTFQQVVLLPKCTNQQALLPPRCTNQQVLLPQTMH